MKCFHVKSSKSQTRCSNSKLFSGILDSLGNWGRSVFSILPMRILDGKQDLRGLKRMYNSKKYVSGFEETSAMIRKFESI